MCNEALENLLHENRTFPPGPAFAAAANATSLLGDRAAADRVAFWEDQARRLDWAQPWDAALPMLVARPAREEVPCGETPAGLEQLRKAVQHSDR